MIRFIDIRNQGTGERFAFWNTVVNQFLTQSNTEAWGSWKDFVSDCIIEDEKDKRNLKRLKGICPEWVFNNDEDALEDWIAGEAVSPCENCQQLKDKIEQMKTDHALEQLDRNMAKDRNA